MFETYIYLVCMCVWCVRMYTCTCHNMDMEVKNNLWYLIIALGVDLGIKLRPSGLASSAFAQCTILLACNCYLVNPD